MATTTTTGFFLSLSDPETQRGERDQEIEREIDLSLPLYVRGFTGAELTRVESDSESRLGRVDRVESESEPTRVDLAHALRLGRPSRIVGRRVGSDSSESSITGYK